MTIFGTSKNEKVLAFVTERTATARRTSSDVKLVFTDTKSDVFNGEGYELCLQGAICLLMSSADD